MRKKPMQVPAIQPFTTNTGTLGTAEFPHVCALCHRQTMSAAEHDWHFQTAHTGWVDQMVIAMCFASKIS